VLNRTLFFLDADTGMEMGTFLHPRPQTAQENCTWHNLNTVPLKNKNGKPRYVFVSGNYQSGISVVDFTDPMHAEEIAFVDPPPLSPTQLITGGTAAARRPPCLSGPLLTSLSRRGKILGGDSSAAPGSKAAAATAGGGRARLRGTRQKGSLW
jgi:hypothetical protein